MAVLVYAFWLPRGRGRACPARGFPNKRPFPVHCRAAYMRPPGCRKTLVGASIARPRPFALQETIPENALLRQVGGRPMVAPTPQQYFTMQQRQTSPERSRPFPSVSKNLPLRNRIPRYGGGGACARGGAVSRRGGGREPCHSPKYFGQPHSSLPHRLRAEPPHRGGQGVSTPFSTAYGTVKTVPYKAPVNPICREGS